MIFPFRKKVNIQSMLNLSIDLHSHLIPSIDDGSKSMKESLTLLKGMKALGYERVITTPHIMMDAYPNTPDMIKNGLYTLRQAAKDANIDIEIEAAAEYYLDEAFLDHMQADEVMSIAGKYILFETSYVSKPLQIEEMIFEISSAGYIPLMAHPERYRYIRDPKREYRRFKELGVKFQVNINSFGGHYGKSAKYLANFLNKEGMIDFLGSDVHHQKHIDTLGVLLRSEIFAGVMKNNTIQNQSL